MSEEDNMKAGASSDDNQILTTKYTEGQLQIVEVTPYSEESMLPEPCQEDAEFESQQPKFILDPEKGLVPLDLLNLTLVRCADSEDTYQLMTTNPDPGNDDGHSQNTDGEITRFVNSSDGEETDTQSYMIVDNGDEGPVVILQRSTDKPDDQRIECEKPEEKEETESKPKKVFTSDQVMKVVQNIKKMNGTIKLPDLSVSNKRGRKRKSDLPPPHVLLSSPNFKLFLYSCKMCSFKCNAIKELTAHKNSEHNGSNKPHGGRPWSSATLQCARCPFRGSVHSQLMKHVQETHLAEAINKDGISLDSAEADLADVLVCGACGYESGCKKTFRKHIAEKHTS